MLRCIFWLSVVVSGTVRASECALFMTVNNYTTQKAVLIAAPSTMHNLVGDEILAPGEVFIAKFARPEHIKPYLVYRLKNQQTQGQCYLRAQSYHPKINCTGPFRVESIYLGENSYEFSLYDHLAIKSE